VGPSADIYSLGCVLYEMLAGEPPFTGKNAAAIMARHIMEQVPSIRIIRQSVPEEVEEAIFAAMGKIPADRPQTAAAFAEILGVPLGATSTRRATRGQTGMRRTPTGATRSYRAMEEEPVPVWRKPWALGLAALLVAGGGFGAYWFGFRDRGPAVAEGGLDPKHVAILYFEDLSKDKRLGFLADGLTEALISSLGQVQGLSVVSRGGVQAYRNDSIALDSIARALGTGTLVRGTIEPEGSDKLTVNVKLLDGSSGADLYRTGLTLSAIDFLAVRDSVAQEVAQLIRERLGQEIKLREQRQSTRNVEAWALLQRGEQLKKSGEAAAGRNDTTAMGRDFRAADSLLAGAEKLDGKWPDPVVLRGLIAYRRSRFPGLDPLVAKGSITEGLGHSERAIALDPDNPDALELRGTLNYWSWLLGLEPDKDKAKALLYGAKADLEKATQANPGQAGAWATLSHLYNQTPENTQVDVNLAARRALEADAFLGNADVIINRLFLSSYDMGQFPDADHWCQELGRRFPASLDAPSCELFLQTTKARTPPDVARAWALADSVTQQAPETDREFQRLYHDMLVAIVLARAGQADSARNVIERSKGNAEIDPTRDLTLLGAYGYAQLGDKDQAINLLKIYLSANERRRAGFADDPGWQLRSLAEDPRFKQLVTGS
jgi:serine/threonine-protein kinase